MTLNSDQYYLIKQRIIESKLFIIHPEFNRGNYPAVDDRHTCTLKKRPYFDKIWGQTGCYCLCKRRCLHHERDFYYLIKGTDICLRMINPNCLRHITCYGEDTLWRTSKPIRIEMSKALYNLVAKGSLRLWKYELSTEFYDLDEVLDMLPTHIQTKALFHINLLASLDSLHNK